MPSLTDKRDCVIALLRSLDKCAVAFSGGVDSAVVAAAAYQALGDRSVAVTAVSASLADGELDSAIQIARHIGIRHEVIQTNEFSQPQYVANASDRCFHCKTELYQRLGTRLVELGMQNVVNGANADDVGDHRPGMVAAANHQVRSPLLECGVTKQEVRQLAQEWGLPVWDKPAAPCLSSRVAYGVEVTPERLRKIDLAEQYLRGLGLSDVRVRLHEGNMARLEVPLAAVATLCQTGQREPIVDRLKELGFRFVTVDLEGFRSGSLNDLLPPVALVQIATPLRPSPEGERSW